MLLIIVGAGASFDSDWRRPPNRLYSYVTGDAQQLGIQWRPPLAKDLFNEDRFGEYVAHYPPSQGLMDQLRQAAPAVEQELEKIRELSKRQKHLPRQLLAVRYYLRELVEQTVGRWNQAKPDQMTNFTRLITRLEPWRQQRSWDLRAEECVAIVTFNYDTLFDDALTNLLPRFPLRRIEDYTSDPRYQLIKLHGSVNWWREVDGDWVRKVGQTSPATGWARTMFDPPDPYFETGEFQVGDTSYPCVPCLALPTATKAVSDFACPDGHVTGLMSLLPTVTDVLVIGWKGVEGHFLEEWRKVHATKPDPKIHSVSVVGATHEGAVQVADHLVRTVGVIPEVTPTFETFSGFVVDKLDDYLANTLKLPVA
jgi:hypothetical protein